MKNFHIKRILNLNTVEAYFLTDGYLIPPKYCMILVDYKRPSTLEDFPHLNGSDNADDFTSRNNFIKAIIISADEVDLSNEKAYDELLLVPSGFLEDKFDCDWDLVVEVEPEFATQNNLNEIFPIIKRVLQKHNYSLDIENIEEDKFNYLSQD
ncbi:hypothetical protein [Bacillus cereus]|uniref:hypothetical protein n=1 Tax=Bacillus cereus TaxID=1396 RepID=UPI00077A80FB|nr:hypothetical protein [Bacillus cereus]KXY66340.1 hypothetical protein AT275_05600 [Bacillus cereus]